MSQEISLHGTVKRKLCSQPAGCGHRSRLHGKVISSAISSRLASAIAMPSDYGSPSVLGLNGFVETLTIGREEQGRPRAAINKSLQRTSQKDAPPLNSIRYAPD